jgi:ribosomal protein S14
MTKESDNKEENKQKEVREKVSCENCGSHYVYVLADKTVVCRRCAYRSKK